MTFEQIFPLTEIQKKSFTVISASHDGYIRLFKIKETKNLEIVAQINIEDKILSTVPLHLNTLNKDYCLQLDKSNDTKNVSTQELLLAGS